MRNCQEAVAMRIIQNGECLASFDNGSKSDTAFRQIRILKYKGFYFMHTVSPPVMVLDKLDEKDALRLLEQLKVAEPLLSTLSAAIAGMEQLLDDLDAQQEKAKLDDSGAWQLN